jgi:hypothetical protein
VNVVLPVFGIPENVPFVLGSLELTDILPFEDRRLGVQFSYRGVDADNATTYLYDLGDSGIPADIEDSRVLVHFDQIRHDVLSSQSAAGYTVVDDLDTEAGQLIRIRGGPTWWWTAFRIRYPDSDDLFFSFAFLRTDRGYFNKVRYTYAKSDHARANERMLRFLGEWTVAVKSSPASPRM